MDGTQDETDHLFGGVAVELGLVSIEHVAHALVTQRSMRERNAEVAKSRLGEVLILMKALTVEQVKRVLSEQRKLRQLDSDRKLHHQKFGEYTLLSKLGEGGMGAVYKAEEPLAHRIVALKVLRPVLASTAAFIERFDRETKLAGSLSHPNIVACHAAGTIQGIQYLVMEYVDGETLTGRLKRAGGKLPEQDALRIARDVARALAYAHAAGIIHRDIKPDNILIAKDGSVKLSDFGTAKSMLMEAGVTHTGQVIGTPNYISPEQVRADKTIDARADLYSLGATLYHVLTGQLPFQATSPMEIMRLHLTQQLDSPLDLNSELSDGAVEIVVKLMAKSRDKRYQNAADLIEDLDQVLAAASPKHSAIDVNESVIRPPRRPRKKRGKNEQGCLSVIVVVVGLSVVVRLCLTTRRPNPPAPFPVREGGDGERDEQRTCDLSLN